MNESFGLSVLSGGKFDEIQTTTEKVNSRRSH